jgi:hypothetical protein
MVRILYSIKKFLEAIVTALAVVFDLQPDPSAVPVEIESRRTSRSA